MTIGFNYQFSKRNQIKLLNRLGEEGMRCSIDFQLTMDLVARHVRSFLCLDKCP